MVDIQSKEVIDKMSEELKVQPAMALPRKLNDSIQPVYNVNPFSHKLKLTGGGPSDATSSIIHTCSTEKDTYLVAVNMSTQKSALHDGNTSAVRITTDQQTAFPILLTRYEPLTAASNIGQEFALPIPIKLKRGSNITCTNETATASVDTRCVVIYYETDPQ